MSARRHSPIRPAPEQAWQASAARQRQIGTGASAIPRRISADQPARSFGPGLVPGKERQDSSELLLHRVENIILRLAQPDERELLAGADDDELAQMSLRGKDIAWQPIGIEDLFKASRPRLVEPDMPAIGRVVG